MIREGAMVRGSGPPMKVAFIKDSYAECVFIDSHGVVRTRFVHVASLQPMWQALQPRSLWPEITRLDQIANDREERQILREKEDARRSAKKAKRSNKIKRRVAPA
jgi:hypothetical protein